MEPISAFFLGLALVTAMALGTLLFVRKPLRRLLVELCGSDDRAAFWAHLFEAALFFTVLLCSILFPPGNEEVIHFYDFLGMFRGALFGALVILALLAMVMITSIGRFESCKRKANWSSAGTSKDGSATG